MLPENLTNELRGIAVGFIPSWFSSCGGNPTLNEILEAIDTNYQAFIDNVTLNDMNDVVITTPQVDEALIYNGTNWVNATNPKGVATVRVATTGNIALSGTQTIDGVTLIAGDRVLVKDQNTPSQNGVYTVAAGAWARATDFNTSARMPAGSMIMATEGTFGADTLYSLRTNAPIVLGTTALEFEQVGTDTNQEFTHKTIDADGNLVNKLYNVGQDSIRYVNMGIYHTTSAVGTSNNPDTADLLAETAALETEIGVTFDSISIYAGLATAGADYADDVLATLATHPRRKVLYVLEPFGGSSTANLDDIIASLSGASGTIYNNFVSVFQAMRAGGNMERVILAPFHECNGASNYPWQIYNSGNTSAKLKQAYQLVVTLARSLGVTSKFVQWYMTLNSGGDLTPFADHYAGDAYVDIIGLTDYNRYGVDYTSWRHPGQMLKPAYDQIVKFTDRPIWICESSSSPDANGDVNAVLVTNGGSGYATAPTVSFTAAPGGGTTPIATATVSGGVVTGILVTTVGKGYTTAPTVSFSGGGGSGAAATAYLHYESKANFFRDYMELIKNGDFSRITGYIVFSKNNIPGTGNWLLQNTEQKNAVRDGIRLLRQRTENRPIRDQRPSNLNYVPEFIPTGTEGWTASGTSSALALSDEVPNHFSPGSKSLELTKPSSAGSLDTDYQLYRNDGLDDYLPNQSYTLSFWAKASVNDMLVSAGLRQNAGSFTKFAHEDIKLTTGWEHYYMVIATNTGYNNGFRLPWFGFGKNSAAGKLWVTGIKLEKGARPTIEADDYQANKSLIINTVTATSYTITRRDKVILFTGSSASTFAIRAAASLKNKSFTIINKGTADITLDPNSSEQINGASTMTVSPNQAVTIYSNGTAWYTTSTPASVTNLAPRIFKFTVGDTNADYAYNGSTVETAINAAFTALASAGGDGFLQGRTAASPYTLTASIQMNNKSNLHLRGAGMEQTTINTGTFAGAAIDQTSSSYRYKHKIQDLSIDGDTVTAGSIGILTGLLSDSEYNSIVIKNVEVGVKLADGNFYNNFINLKVENSTNGVVLEDGATDKPNTNHFFGPKIIATTNAFTITDGNQNALFGGALENFTRGWYVNDIGNSVWGTRVESNDNASAVTYFEFGPNSANNSLWDPYVSGNDWDSSFETHVKDYSDSNTDGNPFFGGNNNITILGTFKDQFVKWVKTAATEHDFIHFIRNVSGYNKALLNLQDKYSSSGNPETLRILMNRATGFFVKFIRGVDRRVKDVLDKDLATPPSSPTAGDRYIVATGGTGAWSGQDNKIAEWNGSSWTFTTPTGTTTVGTGTFVIDELKHYFYNGTTWVTAEKFYIDGNGLVHIEDRIDFANLTSEPSANPTASVIYSVSGALKYRGAAGNGGAGSNRFLHNLGSEVVAAGTAYTLTTTPALLDFGTTDPSLAIPSTGIWMFFMTVRVEVNGATYANADNYVEIKLRNSTDSTDVSNSTFRIPLQTFAAGYTTKTGLIAEVCFPVVFTLTATKTMQIWGSVNNTPSAGSVQITAAKLTGVRLS